MVLAQQIANGCVKAFRTARRFMHERWFNYGVASFILFILIIALVPADDLHDLVRTAPIPFVVFVIGYIFGGGEIAGKALSPFRRKEESHDE
jgi:glycerol uptake facilitator-like aquaporin